jgi:hypothetical protein
MKEYAVAPIHNVEFLEPRSRNLLIITSSLCPVPRQVELHCLEKQSRALQACNLARNIQADGVVSYWAR